MSGRTSSTSEIEMSMHSDRAFQGEEVRMNNLAIYNYSNGDVGDTTEIRFQPGVPFQEATAQFPLELVTQAQPNSTVRGEEAAASGKAGSNKIQKLNTQIRQPRPGRASGSGDVDIPPPPTTEPPPTMALAIRDNPNAAAGQTHSCSICQRPFVQSKLLICQSDPAHDVNGQLYKLCFDCCQCRGPGYDQRPALSTDEKAEICKAEAQHPGLADDGIKTAARLAAYLHELRQLKRRSKSASEPMFQLDNEEENQKAFRTKARSSWRTRQAKALNDYTQKVRNMNWDKFNQNLEADFPGLNKAEARAKFRSLAGHMAERVYEAIAAMPPRTRQVVIEAMDTFEVQLARKANIKDGDLETFDKQAPPGSSSTVRGEEDQEDSNSLGYIPRVTTNIFLDTASFQWVDTVVAGINEYWICRFLDCLLITASVCWLKNGDGGWQFRCPACQRLYQPWVKTAGRIPAQKVLCLTDSAYHPPLMLCDDNMQPAPVEASMVRNACLTLGGTLVTTILSQWPDTSTENLINTLKAATLDIVENVRNQVREIPFEESEAKLLALNRSQVLPQQFQLFEFTREQQEWIDKKNAGAKQGTADSQWSYEHLKNGDSYQYFGMRYRYSEGEEILTYEQTIQMFALSKFVCSERMLMKQTSRI